MSDTDTWPEDLEAYFAEWQLGDDRDALAGVVRTNLLNFCLAFAKGKWSAWSFFNDGSLEWQPDEGELFGERPPLHLAVSPADMLAALRAVLQDSDDSAEVASITKRVREWHLAIAKALAFADLRAAELSERVRS